MLNVIAQGEGKLLKVGPLGRLKSRAIQVTWKETARPGRRVEETLQSVWVCDYRLPGEVAPFRLGLLFIIEIALYSGSR